MAHKRDYKPEDIAFPEQHIVSSELVSEMEKSYIEYAMSVIVGRARRARWAQTRPPPHSVRDV